MCNGRLDCIPEYSTCYDGDDCFDGSDEDVKMCENYTCPEGYWTCLDKTCIVEGLVCDNEMDCPDGSDELNCERYACSEGYIKCADFKTCVAVRLS